MQPPYSRWWRPHLQDVSRRIDYAKQVPTGRQGGDDIFVNAQGHLEPISLLLERGVKVSGTVAGLDDAARIGAIVGVIRHSESLTGESRFSLPPPRAAVYRLHPGGKRRGLHPLRLLSSRENGSLANAVSEPFRSGPGDERTFELTMSPGGWATGKLVGPDVTLLTSGA